MFVVLLRFSCKLSAYQRTGNPRPAQSGLRHPFGGMLGNCQAKVYLATKQQICSARLRRTEVGKELARPIQAQPDPRRRSPDTHLGAAGSRSGKCRRTLNDFRCWGGGVCARELLECHDVRIALRIDSILNAFALDTRTQQAMPGVAARRVMSRGARGKWRIFRFCQNAGGHRKHSQFARRISVHKCREALPNP